MFLSLGFMFLGLRFAADVSKFRVYVFFWSGFS